MQTVATRSTPLHSQAWLCCREEILFSGGFADEGSAGGRRVIHVPGGEAGGVAGDQGVVVDDVWGEAAVNVQPGAFVFVEGEDWREMRDDVPEIDDAVADVEAGVEEADVIGMADARLGPSVNGGREIDGEVVEEIGGRESGERATETMAGDENLLEGGGFGRNEFGQSGAEAFANGFIDKKEALVNGTASGNGAVRRGSEIEVVEPILKIFGATERDDQTAVGGIQADPAEMLVG